MKTSFEDLMTNMEFMQLVFSTIGEIISKECYGDTACEATKMSDAKIAAKALYAERGHELTDGEFNELVAQYQGAAKAVGGLSDEQLNAASDMVDALRDPNAREEIGRTMMNMGRNLMNGGSLV